MLQYKLTYSKIYMIAQGAPRLAPIFFATISETSNHNENFLVHVLHEVLVSVDSVIDEEQANDITTTIR